MLKLGATDDIIAAETVEDLQAALGQFAEIANDLTKLMGNQMSATAPDLAARSDYGHEAERFLVHLVRRHENIDCSRDKIDLGTRP
jgi:hypothetical protein